MSSGLCLVPGCTAEAPGGVICGSCWRGAHPTLRKKAAAPDAPLEALARLVLVVGEEAGAPAAAIEEARGRLDRILGRPGRMAPLPDLSGLPRQTQSGKRSKRQKKSAPLPPRRPPPTIYLSNPSSWRTPGHHGPGRKLLIMARPQRALQLAFDGAVPIGMPNLSDLDAVRAGAISPAAYKVACQMRWWRWAMAEKEALPGVMSAVACGPYYSAGRLVAPFLVSDGDTLLCGCPRRGSPSWRRECHREWFADILEEMGWRVVFDGEERPYSGGSGRSFLEAHIDLGAELPPLPSTAPAAAASVEHTPPHLSTRLLECSPRAEKMLGRNPPLVQVKRNRHGGEYTHYPRDPLADLPRAELPWGPVAPQDPDLLSPSDSPQVSTTP